LAAAPANMGGVNPATSIADGWDYWQFLFARTTSSLRRSTPIC
jgi:hypothetical protein